MAGPGQPSTRDLATEAQRAAARASERLDAHEDACGQRYEKMERRFDTMEERRDHQHRENQAAIAELRREGGEGRTRLHAKVEAFASEARQAIEDVTAAAASQALQAERDKVKGLVKMLVWVVGIGGSALLGLVMYIGKTKGFL